MIVDTFHVHDTRTRYPVIQGCTVVDRGVDEPCGFGYTTEYELRAQLGVTFQCQEQHYQDALGTAVKSLYHRLYNPQLALLAELERSLYNNDHRESIQIINQLRTSMEPPR